MEALAALYPWGPMTAVSATYTLPLRGQEQPRKARAEVLAHGKTIATSDWVVVQPGATRPVEVTVTAEPGTYDAQQRTNIGDKVVQNTTTIGLGTIEHLPPASAGEDTP
jgi:hypothetical protein